MNDGGSFLSVGRLLRRLATGNVEEIDFDLGVNVLVGPPNTGKTKWLQTLDFLLGDTGDNPFEGAEETGLSEKYEAAGVEFRIGEEMFWVERRWREAGAKSKVFVNDDSMPAREFQQWLMEKLGVPLLHFPKGNPMSGQTWPQLSFRMLLRHIYRQQRFWGDLADKQPEGEQLACLMQFLGLAEKIFTKEYGELVSMKLQAERLKASHEYYGAALEALARDVLSEPGLSVGVSAATVRAAEGRIAEEINSLRNQRAKLIGSARDQALAPHGRGRVAELGEARAASLVALEELHRRLDDATERLAEMNRYRAELVTEFDRLNRAEEAGQLLADLRITHCPACDQKIRQINTHDRECFLCHQPLPEQPVVQELGAVRIRFERERLAGEIKEVDEIIVALRSEFGRLQGEITSVQERLRLVENELAPSREAVSALVQDDVSALDVALGEASERQRQIGRLSSAVAAGAEIIERVREIEKKIVPLQARVDQAARSTDFESAAAELEDGMNGYLSAIDTLKPGAWRHNRVRIDISRSGFSIKVGARRWSAVLGGTDTLYFLMAYHYGLLTLSGKDGYHYPGISIIDVPGEFSGESIEDKENFIVQPFIDLLSREEYQCCQLIITGASFSGLEKVTRRELQHVYTA
ncbi:hypothetical protein SAMN06265365_117116 [Tistlia consotensis]|uniref:AAA domain-containing protein n=1 Tax=Tistlia consotensis USBA 355 TaxID=560819 RepID=A0A1Y6CA54_9PROT|nr:hypothetical protein [Tistlia consotensis]SMF51198.1 hypothetical protein SAMN05428998_1183 [Tistlia consotensis USBA 355]SNR84709.1 hypothetical protein SAMN06265365_117116 [Tistlia consotensis]